MGSLCSCDSFSVFFAPVFLGSAGSSDYIRTAPFANSRTGDTPVLLLLSLSETSTEVLDLSVEVRGGPAGVTLLSKYFFQPGGGTRRAALFLLMVTYAPDSSDVTMGLNKALSLYGSPEQPFLGRAEWLITCGRL